MPTDVGSSRSSISGRVLTWYEKSVLVVYNLSDGSGHRSVALSFETLTGRFVCLGVRDFYSCAVLSPFICHFKVCSLAQCCSHIHTFWIAGINSSSRLGFSNDLRVVFLEGFVSPEVHFLRNHWSAFDVTYPKVTLGNGYISDVIPL